MVFTSKGTVGRFAFVRAETRTFVYAPQLCYWRSLDPDEIWPNFLYYWMHSREFRLQASSLKGQTDMADYVSLGDQRRMHITLPPIHEQRAIADVLGSLDGKIELNRRMNRTLEQMAAAIFKAWFVDFEPVRAKASGAASFPGMPQPVFNALPVTFAESELGPVPKGWEIQPFSVFGEITVGGDWGKDTPEQDDWQKVACLRGVDINRLNRNGWSETPHRWIKPSSFQKRQVSPGEIIIEASGHCGRTLVVPHSLPTILGLPGVFSNFCKRFRSRSVGDA